MAYAAVSMTRRGNVADITVSFTISANPSPSADNYTPFSKSRLMALLGVSSLAFERKATSVTFANYAPDASMLGLCGVLASTFGDDGFGFGRIYEESGTFGGWAANRPVYAAGNSGVISIRGASVS